MKQHRTIWMITGCVVLVAAVVLSARQAIAPRTEPKRPPVLITSPHQAEVLVEAMLACLDTDPRARRVMTRRFVEAAATLAEDASFESAETYYALGLRYYGRRKTHGSLRQAEEAYREAIARKPDWSMAHNALGIVLHSMGRTEEAEESFRTAIRLAPDWSRPHNDLAILFRLSGRLEEAQEEALVALRLEPDSVAAHNNYGNLLVELGRLDEAEATYDRARHLEPDQPAPYYNLACLASIRGNIENALAFLNCAIALDETYREEAKGEEDFGPLRSVHDFRRLVYGE
ncbi:MAG: tetratricopeptide repeat protein [Candidatus Hydrogenedentes bacterium]|nr:tetratricopeptide repeat protein [Candidatus Hydrogenedentota bacterium]